MSSAKNVRYKRVPNLIDAEATTSNPAIHKQNAQNKLLPQRYLAWNLTLERTTKSSQKLALFPGADALDETRELPVEEPVALPHLKLIKPDFLLSKEGRKWLPRVTAYCTAG